jgi:thymidylate kinase
MKLILVTGLDGSGKSTLLDRLEEALKGKQFAFLRVPKIEAELFRHKSDLYQVCLFINRMHEEADRLKKPQLKAIALFSAMLIFKDLLKELSQGSVNIVFCERHPLIDTGVYARFYVGKMDPRTLPLGIFEAIEANYTEEIAYLLSAAGIQSKEDNAMFRYLDHIHQSFTVQKKYEIEDLKVIFGLEMPDEIIYLSARPEVLIRRLENRDIKEAHESKAVFEQLIPVYESVLEKSGVPVHKKDASSFEELDLVFEEMVLKVKSDNC